MRNLILLLFLLVSSRRMVQAQPTFIPDTLIVQDFEDPDLEGSMLPFPNGNDTEYVNWDEDGYPQLCDQNGDISYGWYLDVDQGNAGSLQNYCFTSCSFVSYEDPPCGKLTRNWLILPPVFIEDIHTKLQWKSLTYQGFAYLDGYQVLISNTTNLPDAFTNMSYQAAHMAGFAVSPNQAQPTDQSDFTYTPGYIHGNDFSNSAYYFSSNQQGVVFYRGKLEPHEISLADYVGQTIYIAFLHDSECDYLMQLDDILVFKTTPQREPFMAKLNLQASPNPFDEELKIRLSAPLSIGKCQLVLTDATGKAVWAAPVESDADVWEMSVKAEVAQLPSGIYTLRAETSRQVAITRVSKL